MAGTNLSDLLDFIEATGSGYVTGPDTFINDAFSKNEYAFSRLCLANPSKKMVQAGQNIKFNTMFRGSGVGENVKPGQVLVPSNPQRLTHGTVPWRFTRTHTTAIDQEVLLNDAVTYGDAGVRFQQFVNIRDEKRALLEVSMWDDILEPNLWRQPNYATMEGADGLDPQSLPVFLNDFGIGSTTVAGLFDDQTGNTTTNYAGTGNLTIEGLSPANNNAVTQGRWKLNQFQYDSNAVSGASSVSGTINKNIIMGLESAYSACNFVNPGTFATYYTDPNVGQLNIGTSTRGQEIMMSLLRQGQNHYIAGPQDATYPDPQFRGIPVRRYTALDTAALFAASGSTLNTEMASATTNRGPRFYVWNSKFLYPVFHSQRYFYMTPSLTSVNVPDTAVIVAYVWYNLICTSLRRHAVVAPSGAVYTA